MRLGSAIVSAFAFAAVASAACGGREPPPRTPAPPAPPPDPPFLSEIANACARVVSCTRAADTPRLRDPGACVDAWIARAEPGAADPLRKCLSGAKGCAEVEACLRGAGDARAAAFCAERKGVVSGCDGERLVSCGDDATNESTVVDCAQMGASCREAKAASGFVIRACWSPLKCPAGAPEARCEDNTVVACRDGAIERTVCKAGTRCEEHRDDNGDPSASCMLPGHRRCDALGARRCEQGRLVECSAASDRRDVHVSDCVGLGLRCAGIGPRAGCKVASVECDREMLPKCEGPSLVFCAAGRLAKVPCTGIGLGPCDPAARGPLAACSPAK